mmetsp:Transcript_12052/g.21421  ORF Transcript_12052/g.21421 Transcript_12052/m.21421 type:complete len:239 (+) Transcript_12052:32-748(+)
MYGQDCEHHRRHLPSYPDRAHPPYSFSNSNAQDPTYSAQYGGPVHALLGSQPTTALLPASAPTPRPQALSVPAPAPAPASGFAPGFAPAPAPAPYPDRAYPFPTSNAQDPSCMHSGARGSFVVPPKSPCVSRKDVRNRRASEEAAQGVSKVLTWPGIADELAPDGTFIQSKYRGLSRCRASLYDPSHTHTPGCRNWQVRIYVNGGSKYLGTFRDEVEAALAYDMEARLHGKRTNILNR